MNNIIEVKNLIYYSDKQKILDNISFDIRCAEFATFICNEASGKTTLCNIMTGLISTSSYIKIDNMILKDSNVRFIRKKISYISENNDNIFLGETIKDDIFFYLKNKGFKNSEIEEKIKRFSSGININKLLSKSSNTISLGQKQIISLFLAISCNPKILILDNALSMVDKESKNKIYRLMKQYNKKGLTIINFTNDSNDSIYGNTVGIMSNGRIVIKEDISKIFNDDKVFVKNGISLPFIVELSKKLSYYNIVDSIQFDYKKLVDTIWK